VEPDNVIVLASLASSHKERPVVTGVALAGDAPKCIAAPIIVARARCLRVFLIG
jgi:hypothetical protein